MPGGHPTHRRASHEPTGSLGRLEQRRDHGSCRKSRSDRRPTTLTIVIVLDLPPWALRGFAFVFGAMWGSFFNVAIYRWPRDMSVVTPKSHCPACGKPVRAHHNIPLLGYLFLRGRAACCGARLHPRYLVVELLAAVLCLALVEKFVVRAAPTASLLEVSIEALIYFAFGGGLIVATFTDIDGWEIPDEVTLPGTALGLLTVSWRALPGAESAAIGAGSAYLFVQGLLGWVWQRLTGRAGMGEGDALLLMMIGAFIGWRGAAFTLLAASLQGTLFALLSGLVFVLTGKQLLGQPGERDLSVLEDDESDPGFNDDERRARSSEPPPRYWGHLKAKFGPFLALSALQYLFFGDAIIDWAANLFHL